MQTPFLLQRTLPFLQGFFLRADTADLFLRQRQRRDGILSIRDLNRD
jgi:hypothetical protein